VGAGSGRVSLFGRSGGDVGAVPGDGAGGVIRVFNRTQRPLVVGCVSPIYSLNASVGNTVSTVLRQFQFLCYLSKLRAL